MNAPHGTKGFALDRTSDGHIRINPISVGNLVALLTLVGVATSSYGSMISGMAVIQERIVIASLERARLESEILNIRKRDEQTTEKLLSIQQRLSIIEAVTTRLERKLDTLVK